VPSKVLKKAWKATKKATTMATKKLVTNQSVQV
jgi:hypothetical protein